MYSGAGWIEISADKGRKCAAVQDGIDLSADKGGMCAAMQDGWTYQRTRGECVQRCMMDRLIGG